MILAGRSWFLIFWPSESSGSYFKLYPKSMQDKIISHVSLTITFNSEIESALSNEWNIGILFYTSEVKF